MSTNAWFAAIIIWLFAFGFTNNGFIAVLLSLLTIGVPLIRGSIKRTRYKTEDFDDERLKVIEKNMKEPKGIAITDYEERIRRNLLVTAFFTLAFVCLDLQISQGDSGSFFGIKISNLTTDKIYILLIFIISYEFLHYLWNLKVSFIHWRIRLTGITHSERRGGSGATFGTIKSSPLDYSGKDENSSLYVWMFENLQTSQDLGTSLKATAETLEKTLEEIENSDKITSNNTHLQQLKDNTQTLSSDTAKLIELVENVRIDGSLLRFDQWFRLLIVSQNIRWLFLDVILPISVGLLAITSLIVALNDVTVAVGASL
ncbi:hypothetical protein C0J08_19630 [Marinomonas sp. CT5]|uniref:hypothetical protein n=1 Tax=Marinomonas sp. CT5 TaxID=2066133 RepID=UPI001BAF0626|nr:hypothetical protein [Marinomonas sp. CT5]QUX97471.1 hypothetical protein C0J08_19630 [Marinomonas sp. CT5]